MSTAFGWCLGHGQVPHEVCPIRLPHPRGRLASPIPDPGAPDWLECGCECHDQLLGRTRDTDGGIV